MKENSILKARTPSLHEIRQDAHLLVWGDLPDWMAVDREMADFIARFDGKRSLRDVVEAHRAGGGDPGEALAAAGELSRRGILSENPGIPRRPPESLKIANVTVNITNRCNLRCPWCYNAGRTTADAPPSLFADSLRAAGEPVEITHVNLNDGTVEGLAHTEKPLFSVQYHPEASPGPHDAGYFFERFREMVVRHKAGERVTGAEIARGGPTRAA